MHIPSFYKTPYDIFNKEKVSSFFKIFKLTINERWSSLLNLVMQNSFMISVNIHHHTHCGIINHVNYSFFVLDLLTCLLLLKILFFVPHWYVRWYHFCNYTWDFVDISPQHICSYSPLFVIGMNFITVSEVFQRGKLLCVDNRGD